MAVRFLPVSPVGIGNGCSATHTAAGDDVFLAGRLPFCVHPKQEEEKKRRIRELLKNKKEQR